MSRAWWAEQDDPRRASGRTWTARGVTTGAIALVMVGTAATVGATSPHAPEVTTTATGTLQRPSVRALAAGCSSIEFVTDPTSKVGTVDYAGELPYAPTIPVSGWFSSVRADPSDPDATPEQVLHGMWFGDRVLWVAPDAPASTVTSLETFVAEHPQWNATVRTWPEGRVRALKEGTFAIASWGAVQTCANPDPQVISDLFAVAGAAPGADGTPPPVAVRPSADRRPPAQDK